MPKRAKSQSNKEVFLEKTPNMIQSCNSLGACAGLSP